MNRSKFFRWSGYFFAVAWILLLSELVFSNLKATTELREQLASQNQTASVQALEVKVIELSETVTALQNASDKVSTSDLQTLQNYWNEQFNKVLEQGSQYSLTSELIPILEEVKTLQERVKHMLDVKPNLNPSPEFLPPATTLEASKVKPSVTQPAVNPAAFSPPFKVMSVELRQGEQVLSVVPHTGQSASDIQLLRVGDRYGDWVLSELNHQEAVFKVGRRTHRIHF